MCFDKNNLIMRYRIIYDIKLVHITIFDKQDMKKYYPPVAFVLRFAQLIYKRKELFAH